MTNEALARRVLFCPQCGNVAPQVLRYTHRCHEEEWSYDGESVDLPAVYFVVSCETCDGFLVYGGVGPIPDNDFAKVELLWPEVGLHRSVPKKVSEIYAEAARIRRIAPNAFATQIRRALEAICEDRKAKPGPLVQRLLDLAARGEIPPTLAELSDTLRTIGNTGAHATDSRVEQWQVYSIDEFFRAIIEYLYVAPSKLAQFKKTLVEHPSSPVDEA